MSPVSLPDTAPNNPGAGENRSLLPGNQRRATSPDHVISGANTLLSRRDTSRLTVDLAGNIYAVMLNLPAQNATAIVEFAADASGNATPSQPILLREFWYIGSWRGPDPGGQQRKTLRPGKRRLAAPPQSNRTSYTHTGALIGLRPAVFPTTATGGPSNSAHASSCRGVYDKPGASFYSPLDNGNM